MQQQVVRDVLTPEQAAQILQINRETVYRYIRQGKLVASKLGRAYRVPRQHLQLFLWATRTQPNIPLRFYTDREVNSFLKEDFLDAQAGRIVRRLKRSVTTQ